MSIRMMEAVFKLPLQAHRKLVLLALADNASDNGRCWPGQESLAERASISVRHVRDHLHALEADGYLSILSAGNGRGQTTQYLLNVAAIMSGSAFTGKADKADPMDDKGGPLDDKGGPLRHAYKEEPSKNEPSRTVTKKRVAAAAAPSLPDSRVKDVMQSLEDERGYVSEHHAAEAAAAKKLLSHGYTPDEILACYRDTKRLPFWADKGLQLMSLATQIGEWKKNGGHRNGSKGTGSQAVGAISPFAAYSGD